MLLLSYLSYAVNNLVILALYYREVLLKLKSVVVPTAVPCGGGVSHLLVCRNWRLHTYLEQGLQTAAGVPLQCDERPDFKTFRIGLFGLDKWHHVDHTVANLADALDRVGLAETVAEAVPG